MPLGFLISSCKWPAIKFYVKSKQEMETIQETKQALSL